MDVDDEEEEESQEKRKPGKKEKKAKKNRKNKDKDMEEFMEDIGKNKELRKNINLYKDEKAIEQLNKQMNNLGLDEKDLNDSDVDIKINELLDEIDDLTLENKKDKNKEIKSNENEADKIGKRERDGKSIKDE